VSNPRISPLPEAIDGKHWTVLEGRGSCDPVSRILGVPTDDSPGSRFVRNHELGHAKITPRVPAFKQCRNHGVSMDAMQVCEDLRVHRYLGRTGIEMCGVLTDEEADQFVRRVAHNDRELAAHLVASLHTDDHQRILSAVQRHVEEGRRRHIVRMTGLVDARMARGWRLDRPIGFKNGTIPAARLFDAVFPEPGAPEPQLPADCLFLPGRGRAAKWGEMQVETLPASRGRPIPALARSKSYLDHGAALAAPHRLPVDGRVFQRNRRQRGGTVLIDASGSMRFSPADLERITATAPLATVAVYSGHGRQGTLSVVAARGRMVSADDLAASARGRGNIIDGPALRWLAGQPEPRVWVSDGLVTGTGDRTATDLVVDAIQICRQGRITRAEKTDSVCQLLRTKKGGIR
jgi:hypothetical protein